MFLPMRYCFVLPIVAVALSVAVVLAQASHRLPLSTSLKDDPSHKPSNRELEGITRESPTASSMPKVNDSEISVELSQAIANVSEEFLSVTIDCCAIRYHWSIIDFSASRVVNMAKALSPLLLRVGGTDGDFVIFESGSEKQRMSGRFADTIDCFPTTHTNFTMNTSEWDVLNVFVKAANWEIIYGLNVLLREPWPKGKWDSSNAVELMKYSTSKGYNVNWELGNEPDLFDHVAPNIPVTPEQLAQDFGTLNSLVGGNAKYIAGPDVGNIENYFVSFLESVDSGVLNAATYHHYYTSGQTAKLPDFFSVSLLDSFITKAKSAQAFVARYQPSAELWLGETSSCYHGGAPGLSDAYVAGFMWLDKLGIAAVTNHTRVFRQDFVGLYYSLLDGNQNPLPDYWLSALYKKLVGTRVLLVENSLESGRYIRAYAHCAKSPSPSGSVVLLLLNLNTYDTNATLVTQELISSSRDVYWLTPLGGTANITSHEILLNGHLLHLDGDTLPDLEPEEQKNSDTIFLPALSFGFYIFKDAKATACM